jgi:selenocysteine lyase/cysteine desulfurase
MSRRTRWILLALIVVLVGGVAALVLTQQPKLDDARSKVDTAWKPLREQLPLRYQTLSGALSAFDAAGGTGRGVSKDLRAALDRWDASLHDGDAGTQARAANAVEAQGTRLVANLLGSERIRADKAVTDALAKFATTTPNAIAVDGYNHAVRDYEADRTDALAQPVARVLGFGARPVLALGTGGASGGA